MKWRSLDEAPPAEDSRSLREQLAERKELSYKYVPRETQAIHARVIAELKEQPTTSLSQGTKAPEFVLKDHNGKPVSSAKLLNQGRLVVCFFRGRWCPFCVGQLEAMNQILPQIKRTPASLVAISPQTAQQSFFMADQHKLGFPLLSDPGNSVARACLVFRTACPIISRKCIGAYLLTCPSPTGTKAGNSRFLRFTSWTKTAS